MKIAPKITGRIVFLNVREGDHITKGQVLVRIDSWEVEADVNQAMAAVAEARYHLAQAKTTQNPANVAVNTQIYQQKAGVESCQADYNQVRENYKAQVQSSEAAVTDAQSRIDNAKAAINSAQANLDNVQARYDRTYNLYKQGFTAAQDVDDAKTAVAVQKAALDSANGQMKSANATMQSAEEQLKITKTSGLANIEASRAKLVQAQASLEYANANKAQKPAYEQSIQALQASLDAAQANLRSAEARRADTVLVSPLDGYVTGRYLDPGGVTTPGTPILAVQFMKQVWVTISVPQELSNFVHIGQAASTTFDAFPGKSFAASVIQVNPSDDLMSRQFMVRVVLPNPNKMFKPGMFGRVTLETERVNRAVAVPREAVLHDLNGSYVMAMSPTARQSASR